LIETVTYSLTQVENRLSAKFIQKITLRALVIVEPAKNSTASNLTEIPAATSPALEAPIAQLE
jgi:hypothetical protein